MGTTTQSMKIKEAREKWAKCHQGWLSYITLFESYGFDGVAIFGLDGQLWAKSLSKVQEQKSQSATVTANPTEATSSIPIEAPPEAPSANSTTTATTCTSTSTSTSTTPPSTTTSTTTTLTSSNTSAKTDELDPRLFGIYGEPKNVQLHPSDWHIHEDEVRALITGLSNTKTIGLQLSTEEEEVQIATQREACTIHMIPDLVSFVMEYLKEGPTFGEALGTSGVLIGGCHYRFIRGEPLDFIIGLKRQDPCVIYRTNQAVIIGTGKSTGYSNSLRDLTCKMGNVVDKLKAQGF